MRRGCGAFLRSGRKLSVTRAGPATFTATHSMILVARAGSWLLIPLLLIRTSSLPCIDSTLCAAAVTEADEVTSISIVENEVFG